MKCFSVLNAAGILKNAIHCTSVMQSPFSLKLFHVMQVHYVVLVYVFGLLVYVVMISPNGPDCPRRLNMWAVPFVEPNIQCEYQCYIRECDARLLHHLENPLDFFYSPFLFFLFFLFVH